MSTVLEKALTLADIAGQLGYQPDSDALRKLWGRTPILRSKPYSGQYEPTDIELFVLLTKLSKNSGQRPVQIADNARSMMAALELRPLEVGDNSEPDDEPTTIQNGTPHLTPAQKTTTPQINGHSTVFVKSQLKENGTFLKGSGGQPPINGQPDNGQPDNESDYDWSDRIVRFMSAVLPWAISLVHWGFILAGQWRLGDLVGFFVGGIVVLLSAFMQIKVSDPKDRDTATGALWFTFFFCIVSGWLFEYPGLKIAYSEKAEFLPIPLGWYAGIIASAVAGAAFVAVYLRWNTAQQRYLQI